MTTITPAISPEASIAPVPTSKRALGLWDTFVLWADLGISLPTLYREAALKRIRISKIGARSIIFRSDRAAYVALLKSEAGTVRAAGNPPKNAA